MDAKAERKAYSEEPKGPGAPVEGAASGKGEAAGKGTGMENSKNLSVRGGIFVGKVTSAKAPLTVTVEKEIVRYVPKYERYKKDRAILKAHNPPQIGAAEGDIVRVGETRKISKTKSFLVLEIIKKGGSK